MCACVCVCTSARDQRSTSGTVPLMLSLEEGRGGGEGVWCVVGTCVLGMNVFDHLLRPEDRAVCLALPLTTLVLKIVSLWPGTGLASSDPLSFWHTALGL